MHRFLYMRSYALSISQSLDRGKCLQCRTRHLSTKPRIETSPIKTRKKRSKTNKKFAELLVVGDNQSEGSFVKHKAIKVHRLRPEELGRLALSNLDLSELYKLKCIGSSTAATEHTYNNLTDIDNLPTNKFSDFIVNFLNTVSGPIVKYEFYNPPKRKSHVDELPVVPPTNYNNVSIKTLDEGLEEEARQDNILDPDLDVDLNHLDDALPVTVSITPSTRPPQSQKKIHAINARIKADIAVRTLASYIDVCNSLRYTLHGLQALQYHRRRTTKCQTNFPLLSGKIVGVGAIYTGLLRGFAAKASLVHIEEVVRCAKEDCVPLPLDGHAAVLECIGRLINSDSEYLLKEIRMATKAVRDAGFTYDDIINKGIFHNDQQFYVLKAMRHYDPSYKPNYTLPTVQYDNKLVNTLNHPDQLMDPFTIEENSTEQRYCKRLNSHCSEAKLQASITEQLDIEQNVYVKVHSVENTNNENDVSADVLQFRLTLERHRQLWQEAVQTALTRDLVNLGACGGQQRFLEAYMRSVPTKDLIAIVITEAEHIAQGSETYSPTTLQLYRDLGLKVWARYRVLRRLRTGVQESVAAVHREYCKKYFAPRHDVAYDHTPSEVDIANATVNPRQAWQWLAWRAKKQRRNGTKNSDASTEMEGRDWPTTAVMQVGRFLYHIVMHDLKVDVKSLVSANSNGSPLTSGNYLPAFYTVFRTQGGGGGNQSHSRNVVKEEVKPHPVLCRLHRAARPIHLSFPAHELPMLCPPVPWLAVSAADTSSTPPGGYLMQPTELMRLPMHAQLQRERLESTPQRHLYPALDALNQLSAVPWQVNEPVLDVVLDVFRRGGDVRLGIPEAPDSDSTHGVTNSAGAMPLRQRLQLRRKKAEMYSMWCDCLYRLSLANHYRGRVFWLPHNMDFRGRTYPVPPHLSHLGSDLARSMLVFAEARPLGRHGLDWLKLHLANLTGAKKREPLDERLRWINEHLPDVLDSADKPLEGNRWWLEADEPWQTLSCCMEVARIIRASSILPTHRIESRYPVHQDGSCNGLQHYAALGRDKQGAHSVNLCAGVAAPQDVYSSVAALVEERRQEDAAQGQHVAMILDGHVKRKVIKQTVMTTVYGVTRFGARLQIARQLKDLNTTGSEFPREHIWAASSYLTTRTFDSLRSMFASAREIQDWFTDCARLISSVCGKSVEWRTPLGLPIVQPYCRPRKHVNKGSINSYAHISMDKHEHPNVLKQKNAFPPNFIHSLDSSHMMLTSLWAERAPITFVSVHDCFWTHPSTVDIMNKLCREQFVALHSEPILADLSLYLSDLYSYNERDLMDDGSVSDLTKKKLNRILNKLPNTGSFDINDVLRSTYFFS